MYARFSAAQASVSTCHKDEAEAGHDLQKLVTIFSFCCAKLVAMD